MGDKTASGKRLAERLHNPSPGFARGTLFDSPAGKPVKFRVAIPEAASSFDEPTRLSAQACGRTRLDFVPQLVRVPV